MTDIGTSEQTSTLEEEQQSERRPQGIPPRQRAPRKAFSFPGPDKIIPPLAVGVGFFLLLELIFRLELISTIILPSPFAITAEAWNQMSSPFMWTNLWITTQEALIGFVFAAVSGIALGIAIGLSKMLARALYPYLILLQSMPRIALVPLFIAIWGFDMTPKIVTAIVLAFFPPLVNTIVGLREVDQDAVLLMRSLSASKVQIFRKLLWPSALPAIFAGLKTGLTLAFLGAFVGELTAANEGIGLLMELAAFELRMDSLFAYLIWFSLVSLVCFGALELLDRKLIHWKEDVRRDVFGQKEAA